MSFRVPIVDGVAAHSQGKEGVGAQLARLREADLRIGAEPHFAAPAYREKRQIRPRAPLPGRLASQTLAKTNGLFLVGVAGFEPTTPCPPVTEAVPSWLDLTDNDGTEKSENISEYH